MIGNHEKLSGVLAALLGLVACSAPGAAFAQSMTVTIDAASVPYDAGTDFNGFVSQTNNPLGPFVGAAVHFTGANTGGNDQIYRYRLEFDAVVQLGSIVVSGAAWEGDTLILQDESGNEIASLAIDSFGNNFQSVLLDLSGIAGRIFYLEERNVDTDWRFRNWISVALADGSSPDLTLGTVAVPRTLASADWTNGNGHRYKVVELPGSDWDTARSHVLANFPGFDLATISNQIEQTFVDSMLARMGAGPDWWLGGFQEVYSEGSARTGWAWVTGQQWQYANWATGEPATAGIDRHLSVTAGSNTANWNDAGADLSRVKGYVAESLYSPSALGTAGLAGTMFATGDRVVLDLRPSLSDCVDRFHYVYDYPVGNNLYRISVNEAFPQDLTAPVTRGQELGFSIPQCGGDTFDIFMTGPGDFNDDGLVHAIITPARSSQPSAEHAWIVSFKEHAADTSFRDIVFELSQWEPFDIAPTGENPVAVDDAGTTSAGIGVAIDVLGNDFWLTDSPIVIDLVSMPANGTAFVTSSDFVSYAPRAGFIGVDTFEYRITDRDGDSATGTVSVTVGDSLGTADDDMFVLSEPPVFPASGGGGAASLLFIAMLAVLSILRSSRTGTGLLFSGVSATVVSLVLLMSARAGAQSPNNEEEEQEKPLETMVIVGSHIRDVDPEGMAPVLVIDRAQIEHTGVITVAEVLEQLPMSNGGSFNDRNALSTSLGGTGMSFRGMGPNAVLVLINGRRATTYGFPHVTESGSYVSFVDLNNIPIAAVERIEVLKDGASAIYGSGAMAGVVNIVLRQEFTGTSLEMRFGAASLGGAEELALSVLSGIELPRTDVQIIATHTSRDQLAWNDRSISASANSVDEGGIDNRSRFATNLIEDGIGDSSAECEERNTMVGAATFEKLPGTGICLFDPNTQIVVPSASRSGVMALVGRELTSKLDLHIEASYLSAEAEGRRDATPWTQGIFPADNPWNPFGVDVLTDYRFTEAGQRVDVIDTENARVVFALEGEIGEWNWEFSALYHSSTTQNRGTGRLSAERIDAALNGIDLNGNGLLEDSEYLNLFSPASNPNSLALTNSISASTLRRSTSTLRSYVFRAAKNLKQLRAGQLVGAFGYARRNESVRDESDPLSLGSLLLAADSYKEIWIGLRVDEPLAEIDPFAHIDPFDWEASPLEPTGFPAAEGSQSFDAVFGEVRMPLLEKLDLQAAARYEEISQFDKELSPRLALRFNGAKRVRARASWSKGFRAPSPGEMHVGPSTKLQGSWEPKRCPYYFDPWTDPDTSGSCITRIFVVATWGNPNLAAEESESETAGVEVDVLHNHTVELECWDTKVDNKILTPDTAWMITHEDELPPGAIVRGRAWPEEPPGYAGGLVQVNLLPLNFGRQEVDGCDVKLETVWDTPGDGQLQAQVLATNMRSNKLAFGADDPLEELAGTFGYPKNRANVNVYWSRNRWQVGVYGRWTDGFAEAFGDGSVGSHTEWDTQVRFAASQAASVTFGIENLLDEAPPFSASTLQGFPVEYFDMRGRFLYAQFNYSLGQRPAPAGTP